MSISFVRNYLMIIFFAFICCGTSLAQQSFPQKQKQDEAVLTLYAIRNADAASAISVIQTLLPAEQGARIGHDPRTNSLIVYAPEKVHRQIEQLLKAIDRPVQPLPAPAKETKNLRVDFIWIVSPFAGNDEASAVDFKRLKTPPPHLQAVLEKLKKRLPLQNEKVASQVVVHVQSSIAPQGEDGKFTARGEGGLGGPTTFKMECSGEVVAIENGSVKIHLQLQASLGEHQSSVDTTIAAPLGHPVCLSVAPLESLESLFIVELNDE